MRIAGTEDDISCLMSFAENFCPERGLPETVIFGAFVLNFSLISAYFYIFIIIT